MNQALRELIGIIQQGIGWVLRTIVFLWEWSWN